MKVSPSIKINNVEKVKCPKCSYTWFSNLFMSTKKCLRPACEYLFEWSENLVEDK